MLRLKKEAIFFLSNDRLSFTKSLMKILVKGVVKLTWQWASSSVSLGPSAGSEAAATRSSLLALLLNH